MGLEPAGDSGGYFQYVPLVRRHFESGVSLTAGSTALRPDSDFVPLVGRGTPRSIDGAQVIYGGVFTDSSTWITAEQAHGKLVVFNPKLLLRRAALLHHQHPPDQPICRRRRRRDSDTRSRAPGVPRARARPRPRARAERNRSRERVATAPPHHAVRRAHPTRQVARFGRARRPRPVIHGIVKLVEEPRSPETSSPCSLAPTRSCAASTSRSARTAITSARAMCRSTTIRCAPRTSRRGRCAASRSTTRTPSPQQRSLIHVNVDSLRKKHAPRMDSVFNGADDDGSGTVSVLEIAQKVRERAAAPATLDSLRLAHRRRARTPRLALVHRSSHGARATPSSPSSTST